MSEDDDTSEARYTFMAIPGFSGWGDATFTRLGGMTNRVFKVDSGKEAFCLRLPGVGTEEYINRADEAQAAYAAAEAGVSPALIYSDPKGIMVTRFMSIAVTMSPELFRSRPGAPARAGQAFRKLHDSGAQFRSNFDLFGMINEYLKLLGSKRMTLPQGYDAALREAEAIGIALNAHPLPSVACHCDPLCENFLDSGTRMWIVDWEYCGMNDPMWDLGDLSVEGGFNAAQDAELIQAYFGRDPSPDELGRMVIYKAMCDLLWTLWGLIQHANKNPADDFWAYANTRFDRCKKLMGTLAFSNHLAAVAKGPE